jgi:WD40 repeat protein
MKKPVQLAAAALGNAVCVCDDGSVSIVPFEALTNGTVEHQVQASKQMPPPFSSREDIVSHAAMLYSSPSRQLMLTSTSSTMHLLSVGGDSTEIIGRHTTSGSITCLSVPSAGLGARLHQHVFVGSGNGSAGTIELIDIDASTARPILSLNRSLVTEPLVGSAVGVSALAALPSNPFLVAAGLTDGTSRRCARLARIHSRA